MKLRRTDIPGVDIICGGFEFLDKRDKLNQTRADAIDDHVFRLPDETPRAYADAFPGDGLPGVLDN